MNAVIAPIQALLDRLNTVMAFGSSLAIAAAGLVLTWEVIGRYFLAIPSDWQDELSTFLLIGATFASAAWTQARRGHVGIDALREILPERMDRVRRVLADLLSAVFCGYFTFKCWQMLHETWTEGHTTPSSWGAPLFVPYGCMTLGMGLLTVQLAVQVFGKRS